MAKIRSKESVFIFFCYCLTVIQLSRAGDPVDSSIRPPLVGVDAKITNNGQTGEMNYTSGGVRAHSGLLFSKTSPENKTCSVSADFINSMSEVLTCVSKNSIPATYCTDCKDQFSSWNKLFELMKNSTVCMQLLSDDSSVATSPSLLGRVVNQTQTYWLDSRCKSCLEMNQTDLMEFRELDDTLTHCLKVSNCSTCLPYFKKMTERYVLLGNGHGCVELKDRLNRTQIRWNNEGCTPPTPDITTAMILSAFFAVLPAVFYTYLRIFGARRTRKLLRAGGPTATPATPASATAHGSAGPSTSTPGHSQNQALLSADQNTTASTPRA